MQIINKLIKDLKKERIIYKLDGDDREYSINLLNYLFNIRKIYSKSGRLRDNVSHIWFKDFYLSGALDVNNCSKVIVSSSDDNIESFSIYGSEGVDIVLNLCDKLGKESAHVVIEDSQYLRYGHGFCDLEVRDAKKIEISGDKCNLRDVVISSDSLEVYSKNVNIRRLNYMGDKVNFNDSNGNIKTVSLNGVSEFKINNCSFESKDASFDIALTPVIKDSFWMFSNPITYNKVIIGNEDEEFILEDDTFNKDKCIDLGRAYVSYALSKLLENIQCINEYKKDEFNNMLNQDIDEVKKYLDNLESQSNDFKIGLDEVKVKSYSIYKNN